MSTPVGESQRPHLSFSAALGPKDSPTSTPTLSTGEIEFALPPATIRGLGLQPGGALQLATPSSPGALSRGALDHLRFNARGTGDFDWLGEPSPFRPNLDQTLGSQSSEIRSIFSSVGTAAFTRENLDRAQAIMNSADIDAQAAIVAHAMGAAGSRYELRPGFDNRTPMETWTTPSLCRDIHTAGAQMLEAAGWRTAAVGYQDAGHSHQNLLAVAPDGRVFMMEYGRLTEYPAGTEPLDVLQSFNVDAPEFYFYNAPDSPDDVANVSASVRTAIGLQVDSALLGRGVILREPGVGVGQDGLGNTTVRFQATDSIAVDAIHLDGHAEGLGVMGRYSNGNESYGVGVFRFQGLRESSIGRREITESDQTALALSFSGHGSFYESTVASLSGGASVRFVSPYDTATTLLYFPESRELTAGMTQVRAGVTPQLSYSHPAGYWATGGMNLELGKATALAA
ncbi:MAG: hypothetical protein AAFY60_13120, partial [Myxococcota bacterium]